MGLLGDKLLQANVVTQEQYDASEQEKRETRYLASWMYEFTDDGCQVASIPQGIVESLSSLQTRLYNHVLSEEGWQLDRIRYGQIYFKRQRRG